MYLKFWIANYLVQFSVKKINKENTEVKGVEEYSEKDDSNYAFIAERYNWKRIKTKQIGLISYIKDDSRINIYTTTGTVGTCLTHPKRGKTQLFRKNLNYHEIKKLFENPRTHTGRGYY